MHKQSHHEEEQIMDHADRRNVAMCPNLSDKEPETETNLDPEPVPYP